MKRAAILVLALVGFAAGAIAYRTLVFDSLQIEAALADPLPLDADAAVARFAESLRHRTISHQIPWEFRGSAFKEFHDFLEAGYPAVHAALEREVVANYSLLYTWPGSEPDLEPILLLAHLDVVPVDRGSEEDWTHPPFDGVIADGFVWGRGAIDNKASVIGILEAVEALLASGFTPRRTVYIAFGHDEEVGGELGAGTIAALLEARGVRAWFCLDEGLAAVQGMIPGIAGPVALIGVAEKGYASFALTVTGEGGHSSQPPPRTSAGVLAAALARLEERQRPARFTEPVDGLFRHAGPEMRFPMNVLMANLWLFRPLLKRELLKGDATAASLRTTTAVTIVEAGTKENVLPIQALAVVNFRLLHGDTVEDIEEHIRRTVNDDRVEIALSEMSDVTPPSPVSPASGPAYEAIARSIRETIPGSITAPGLVLGGTDSKHYHGVAEQVYRFQPFILEPHDMARVHGTNERLGIENWLQGIQCYARILRNTAG